MCDSVFPTSMPGALHEALEAAFGFRARTAREELDVFVLRRTPAADELLTPSETGEWSSASTDSHLALRGATLRVLAHTLEHRLDTPVLDETKDARSFDLTLELSSAEPEAYAAALSEQLGLELARERRAVDLLHIEKY